MRLTEGRNGSWKKVETNWRNGRIVRKKKEERKTKKRKGTIGWNWVNRRKATQTEGSWEQQVKGGTYGRKLRQMEKKGGKNGTNGRRAGTIRRRWYLW